MDPMSLNGGTPGRVYILDVVGKSQPRFPKLIYTAYEFQMAAQYSVLVWLWRQSRPTTFLRRRRLPGLHDWLVLGA